MTTETRQHVFTVDEYYEMARVGILKPDDRVELLDGEIIDMSPIGDDHAFSVDELVYLFTTQLGQRARIRSQNPLRLDDRTELQPDVMLLRWRDDRYSSGHPGPGDVLLLIEVSDTSIGVDRNVKLPRYARDGVPEVWMVNLPAKSVEVFTEPSGSTYRDRRVYEPHETITPAAFEDISLPVSQIIPTGD